VVAGIETTKKDYIRIVDRHEALKRAISIAEKEDIILVAGKGHEKWQSIKGEKMPFDEKKIIGQLARERFGS
jgi:UDP-N-acetylmuramoyl-L-alanyl-D-glutamate--2,6-diaminopimelate ligase